MELYFIHSCGISDCASTWFWETGDNGLSDYDLWAVFRGHGEIMIGDEKYNISPSDCFILPPNTKISAHHSPDDPLLVMNVHFMPSDVSIFIGRNISCVMRNPVFVRELLERVIIYHNKGKGDISQSYFICALNELYEKNSSYKLGNKNNGIIYDICEEINSSNTPLSLDYFAKKYGYSYSYLGKLFSHVMGIDFSSYLINAKINKAKILLKTSNYSIKEIGERLGYYDTSFFIKQFTKVTKITPGKYRNM